MKHYVAMSLAILSLGCIAGGVTTNFVVYTNMSTPKGTCHLHADKLNLVISNGLVVSCQSEGRYDLFRGLPEEEALKTNAFERTRKIGKLIQLHNRRLASKTNEVFRGRQP